MRKTRLPVLVAALLALVAMPSSAAPSVGPCMPGTAYDPACDVNRDNAISITDIQLTAGHWNQTGTWVSDNNHIHLGQTWTGANNPLEIEGAFGDPATAALVLRNSVGHGLNVQSAEFDGVFVDVAHDSGLYVNSAGITGVHVNSAGGDGVYVNSAAQDGVHIYSAGTPLVSIPSAGSNGVEVEGAQSAGLFVGRGDGTGVYVHSAGVYGVYVGSAGEVGAYANTTQVSGQWGFYTDDAIHGSNVLMHSLSLVAQVAGPDSLTRGDVVAVAGVADPIPGSTVHVPLVRLADGSATGIVGVLESRLAITQQPSPTQPARGETPTETPPHELRSADGPARAGDYVAITVLGAAQVKVDSATSIEAGQRLTIAANGHTRPLGTIRVQLAGGEGTADIAESAPVVGVALEAAKDGLVWVLANPQ